MAISDGLGIQALVQSYDKKAVSQAFAEIAKDFGKSANELNNEINKIKIDKDVMNNLVNQIKALPEEVRKKTQGMSFDLFRDLINADGAEEKIDEAFKMFSSKMTAFNKLKNEINNDELLIKIDFSDLDKLIEKEKEILRIETEIQGLNKNTKKYKVGSNQIKSLENENAAWIQSIQQIDKYNISIDEVKKNITELAKSNRNIDWSNIDNKNIGTIKEMVGWLERYVQLTGDISGIKDLNIPGVIDLRKLFKGDTTSVDTNLTQQVKDFQDMIKRYGSNFSTAVDTKSISDDIKKLKEQEQEINKMKESLAEKKSQLEQINQEYTEQSNLVKKLGNELEVLKESKNPKIIETDEYKNIISELEIAKNKANEFQKEIDEANQAINILNKNLQAYNVNDVVPKENLENASHVIDNLNNKINELKMSLTESEQKTVDLSNQLNMLQQDNSSLNDQLSQQKEINVAQQEQISNSQKIKSELDEIKKKYQETKNLIDEMESAQSRYMSLLDKFGKAEAFNKAMQNVNYNECKNTPEGFVNFDYLDKAKQKLQETGDAYENAIKAAVYYYQYLQKGGTEKIFNKSGKDISNELINLYKEMSSLADNKTGQISYESINKTVREYANELRLVKEEQTKEKDLIDQKNKELKESLSLEKSIAQVKKENQKVELETKSNQTKSSNKTKMSREDFLKFSNEYQKKQEKNTKQSIPNQVSQVDYSSILSEQQALEKLKQAINSVTIAITQKNQAIQAEEVQMDSSVNQEIAKLEELKSKLIEIKTQFENSITSELFKNADGNDVALDKEVNLKPTLNSDKFKEDADRLLEFVDVEKEVNIKAGELKVKQTGNNDNINTSSISETLSKNFDTNGKKDATTQLREAYKEFQQFYNNQEALATQEGQEAAYKYYMSYKEALNKNVADKTLNTYSFADSKYDSSEIDKFIIETKSNLESLLKESFSVKIKPLLIQSEWESEIDKILNLIGSKKIKIEPDTTSQEWNDFKTYIEKISNLTINLNLKNVPDNNLNNDSGNKTSKPVIQNIPSAPDPSIIVPIENLSEEWENARRAAQLYDDDLSDIVNVTKQIRTNEKTGERLISYRVSDDQGKQVTVGKNWNLISYTDQIADQVKVAKEQQKQQEKLLKEQQKQQEKLYKDLQKQSDDKQQQVEKANIAEANALLEKQSSLFKDIYTTQSEILQLQRTETSTLEDTEKLNKEIDSLKEKKKLLQEEYVQNNKNLQQYDSYIDKADQLSKLQNISNTFSTKNSADAYKELDSVFKKYENIENRIAKNEIKGIDNEDIGLLDEREKILTRIANIQNQIKTEGLTNTASDIDFSNRNKELEKNIELIKAQAEAQKEAKDKKSSNINLGTSDENLKRLIDLYDQLLSNMQQIKSLQDNQSINGLNNDEEQYLLKLQEQKILLEQKYNTELEKGFIQTTKIKDVIEKTNNLLDKNNNDINLNEKTLSGRESNINISYDEAQKVNSALTRTSILMDGLSQKNIANFDKPLDNARIKLEQLNQKLTSGSMNLADYDNTVNRTVSSLRNIIEVLDDTATKSDGIVAIQKYLNSVSNGNEVKIIDEKTVGNITTLTAEFTDQNKTIQRLRVSYNDLNKQVSNLGTTGKQSITSFSKFVDELGAKFRNLSTYLLSFVGFYEVWGAIQQGVTYVRELDTALTEMRKVSDETVESLREFQEESFDIADSVASTAKEIQNSTADWLRLGYAMDEASELARTTAVYKAVGDDMDIATATESMVSTLQGFQLEADQAANIVDQFNEVSNNFAIDSKGIGDALQRSAASFNAANTGMSESIALITATNAVLQDPEKVGM